MAISPGGNAVNEPLNWVSCKAQRRRPLFWPGRVTPHELLGVIDQITVTPEVRSDEDIRKAILSALLNDPATESYQVTASVRDRW